MKPKVLALLPLFFFSRCLSCEAKSHLNKPAFVTLDRKTETLWLTELKSVLLIIA